MLVFLSVKSNTWIVAFFGDLSYYWMHRMHHEIKILWATHSVHHGENLTINCIKADKYWLVMEMGFLSTNGFSWCPW